MVTSHEEIRQMIQTVKETIEEDEISEQVEIRKHLVHTVGERETQVPRRLPSMRRRMWKVWKEEPLCKGLETKSINSIAPTGVFRRAI